MTPLKTLLIAVTLIAMAGATTASARPHHRHQVCSYHHHHRVCVWR